jgi:hypothetical protein
MHHTTIARWTSLRIPVHWRAIQSQFSIPAAVSSSALSLLPYATENDREEQTRSTGRSNHGRTTSTLRAKRAHRSHADRERTTTKRGHHPHTTD